MTSRRSQRLRLALAALCLAFSGACKVDVAVGIETEADGHGEVRVTAVLDADAARVVGDVDERLRTADLREAGWEVDAPDHRPDGSVVVVAHRAFDGEDGADRALTDLGGEDGPFEDLHVRQHRTFWKTRSSFSGRVDLRRGIDAFADTELLQRLGGPGGDTAQALGVPVDQLERRFGAPLASLFHLEVTVGLPGQRSPSRWTPALGEQASLSAESEQWNARNIALAGASLACALAAGVALVRGRRP